MNIKILDTNNLDEIYTLTVETINKLEKKEWFFLNDYNFFKTVFEKELGIFAGIFNNEKLIAYALLLKEDEYNLFDGGGTLDIVIVEYESRGQGIQSILLKFFEDIAINLKIKYLVATVHPDNIYSSSNFEKENYIIHKKLYKKENPLYIRNLYVKNLLS